MSVWSINTSCVFFHLDFLFFLENKFRMISSVYICRTKHYFQHIQLLYTHNVVTESIDAWIRLIYWYTFIDFFFRYFDHSLWSLSKKIISYKYYTILIVSIIKTQLNISLIVFFDNLNYSHFLFSKNAFEGNYDVEFN